MSLAIGNATETSTGAATFVQPTPAASVGNSYILSDAWVSVIIAISIISCLGCMCTILLYHTMHKWKQSATIHPSLPPTPRATLTELDEVNELPNYTLVSGLPTYAEALEQLRVVKEMRKPSTATMLPKDSHYSTYNGHVLPTRLSVMELLKHGKRRGSLTLDDHKDAPVDCVVTSRTD